MPFGMMIMASEHETDIGSYLSIYQQTCEMPKMTQNPERRGGGGEISCITQGHCAGGLVHCEAQRCAEVTMQTTKCVLLKNPYPYS